MKILWLVFTCLGVCFISFLALWLMWVDMDFREKNNSAIEQMPVPNTSEIKPFSIMETCAVITAAAAVIMVFK